MMDHFQEDVLRGWSYSLLSHYEKIREGIPKLKKMKAPQFDIALDLDSAYGYWEQKNRTIRISYKLLTEHSWPNVLYVLKHEMAHQIVDELFFVTNAKAHGKMFEKACLMLSIPSDRCVTLEKCAEHKKITAKIEKLLALSQSPNHHEAELALQKAQELTLRYNIGQVDIQCDYSYRIIGPAMKKMPHYIRSVVGIISKHYFVEAINCFHAHENSMYRQMEIYGSLENLDMAEYVFYYLLHQGNIEWQEYRRKWGTSVSRMKRTFLEGLYHGFCQKLDEEKARLEEEFALIWTGDPALNEFFNEQHPDVVIKSYSKRVNAEVHGAGQERGRQLKVRPGLNRASKSEGRLLTN